MQRHEKKGAENFDPLIAQKEVCMAHISQEISDILADFAPALSNKLIFCQIEANYIWESKY